MKKKYKYKVQGTGGKIQGTRYKVQGWIDRHVMRGLFLILFLFSVGTMSAQLDTFIKEPPPPQADTETTASEDEEKYFSDLPDHDTTRVQSRHIPDTVVKQMQRDDAFWYANADIKKDEPEEKNNSRYEPLGEQLWFRTLMWAIIIGAFVGFLMWYLASNNIGLFRKKARNIQEAEPGEEIMPEDIFAINYQKEIDKAAAAGNYRLAIRLYFLRLLKDMSEKNIISYKQDRTNFDYVLQLYKTSYYDGFFRLTRNYEYSWYGQFDISPETYGIIKNDFEQFNNQIK